MAQELKSQTSTLPVAPTLPTRMSYEQFLKWADGISAEWVDGEAILLSPASTPHQRLVKFLSTLLTVFIEVNDLGEVFIPPFQMKLSTRPSGREPDLIFISKENLNRLKNTYLDGPADVAVEIVSPDSQIRDREEKFYEYEAAGVPEYWLLDYQLRQAEFYELGADARYQRIEIDDDRIFRSRVIKSLWLRVDWLWQEPLPTVMSVLKEWGLIK